MWDAPDARQRSGQGRRTPIKQPSNGRSSPFSKQPANSSEGWRARPRTSGSSRPLEGSKAGQRKPLAPHSSPYIDSRRPMSFIGKSFSSLSWLGQLFNDSTFWSWSHDEGLQDRPEEFQLEEITTDKQPQIQDLPVETAHEAGTVTDFNDSTAEFSSGDEAPVEPVEPWKFNGQKVPDDFLLDYQKFLKARSRSPSPFWQRRCQRDDAAGDDSFYSESPLSLSAFSDFNEPNRNHYNEESSFEESIERSRASSSIEGDLSSSSLDEPPEDRQGSNHLIVMSGDDFGWSLSDVAGDPRRTGLANFRHNILVRPVPAPSIEILSNVREEEPIQRYGAATSSRHGVSSLPRQRPVRHHYRLHGTEVRSDYETGCGSASSSFDEEGYQHQLNEYRQHQTTARDHHQSRRPHPRADLLPDTDVLALASSRIPRAEKPYRRRDTVSQCSDSCLGSDFPSLTSTGSSESEMVAVTGQSSVKGYERPSRATLSGTFAHHVQQQQPKAFATASSSSPSAAAVSAPGVASAVQQAAGTSSTTSSQTSLGSSSTDCWRGSIQHALTVMEHRGQEMSSLFDQLHEIGDDLASMDDQVGQVTNTLQQCQNRRQSGGQHQQQQQQQRRPFLPSQSVGSYQSYHSPKPERRGSTASSIGSASVVSGGRRRHVGSCLDLRSLTEDQMAVIVHRLLTRVCEHTLARQEGRLDVPLIV